MHRAGNTPRRYCLPSMLLALLFALTALCGCTQTTESRTTETTEAGGEEQAAVQAAVQAAAQAAVPKQPDAYGGMVFGEVGSDGLSLSLPAGACDDIADIELHTSAADGAPAMPHARPTGQVFSIKTEQTRLNEAATLVYRYDPSTVDDPLLLCLGYFDGTQWHYTQAETKDEAEHTVTFTLYHFSEYYPAQFEDELDAAKHYTEQLAARRVLGERGGDPKAASRAILDYLAGKMGVSENETVMRTLADIASDDDMVSILDEAYESGGWTQTGYQTAIAKYCDKVADYMVKNRTGIAADEGAVLTMGEKAMKEIGDLMGNVGSASKFLGALAGGDTDAAATELLGFIADNTGALGTSMKYAISGMQNALDVWREDEVEKAFKVYTEGAKGSIFGYGAVEAGDFDEVWESMGAASRQLCIDRIAEENSARRLLGMEPLNAKEESFYRDKVKEELKGEFERRTALNARIEEEKKNLDLIFERLEADDMLDSSTVWYRGFGGAEETLIDRMGRMEHLVQRIYRDLGVDTVYADAPLTRELDGSISAYSMSEMIRAYFSAENMAEAEEALQQYYKDNFDLGVSNEDIAGSWRFTVSLFGETRNLVLEFTPSGDGGVVTLDGRTHSYDYSQGTVTFAVYYPSIVDPNFQKTGGVYLTSGEDSKVTIGFTKEGRSISGSGTYLLQLLDQNNDHWGDAFPIPITLEKME